MASKWDQAARNTLGGGYGYPAWKYDNEGNIGQLAMGLDQWESLHPGAEMTYDIIREVARKLIAAGQITETSDWAEVFSEFHKTTQDTYKVIANQSSFEQFLRAAKPTVELLLQVVHEHPDKFIMSAQATNQAERDQLHEKLFHEIAPRLITDIPAGSNRYAVQLENKRLETRRQQLWDLSLEQLQEIKAKHNMRDLPVSELKKIVNANEPNRQQQILQGDRHQAADDGALETLRQRAADAVASGRYRQITPEYEIPGKPGITVPFSAQLLYRLPKSETEKLTRVFGTDQLTYMVELTRRRLVAQR